jgi:hypothetical protein
MSILKVLFITIILLIIVVLALSVRLLFKPKAEIRGTSCNSYSQDLKDKNIGCGCGESTGSCQAE